MGKTQSKSLGLYRKRDGPEGECFVVNAHFNPLAVAELDEAYKPPKTPSEITLSLSSCAKDSEFISRAGFSEDKYPLQVVLPPEGSQTSSTSCAKEAIEKSDIDDSSEVDGKKDLTFHGFECDVSVEADVAGHEKQEFLFTLYDLDGYGKITKDDIASLVRSIYEAMGSSIKLPPSGSKTIKVKLTVAPDKKMKEEVQGMQENGKVCSEKEAKHVTEDEREHDDEDERNDADAEEDDEEEDADEDLGNEEKSYPYPILSSHRHRHRASDRSRKNASTTPVPKNTLPCHRYSAPQPTVGSHQQHRSSCIIDEQRPPSPSPGRKRNKVCFSSPRLLQKHQLLEIIQANLEKNHFGSYVDSSKKRFGENGEDDVGHRRHSKLRQHHCSQRYKEGRSHYLDLAGIENYAPVLDRNVENDLDSSERIGNKSDGVGGGGGGGDSSCPYQAMDSTHVCSKIRERGQYACHKPRHHHRSKSHDLADSSNYFRYQVLQDEYSRQNLLRVQEMLKDPLDGGEKLDWFCAGGKSHRDRDIQAALYRARSKSYDAYYCETAPVSFSPRLKVRPSKDEMPAGSPHHHKHRHRERDHQRAMQQVASWIEREHLGHGESHSANLTKGDTAQCNAQQQRSHYHHHHHQVNGMNQRPSPPHGTTPRTPDKAPLLVERHEHHHYHEHYHHHYHHYHEL